MSAVNAQVSVAPGSWVNIGTGPLIARLPAPDFGLFVELRIQDSAPAVGALPHRMLGGENHMVEIGDANGVWALNVSASGGTVALDVTTGLTPAGGSGGGGGGGSDASVGSTGAAAPTSATAVGFQNASGNLVLPTPSAGLPVADSGAAITGASIPAGGVGLTGWLSAIWSNVSTAANQTTANTTLSSILTNLGAVVLSAGSAIIGKVGIDQTTPGTTNGVQITALTSGVTVPVSGPTGAGAFALASNQSSQVTTSAGNAGREILVDPTSGAGVTTTTVGAKQRMDVVLAAGAATGAAAPAYTDVIGGIDVGGLARQLFVDTTGRLILGAGPNIIGYAGSLNFQTAPVVPKITGAAYALGNVIGSPSVAGGSGINPVSVFRTTTQPSATLAQFLLGWAGTETVAVTVYLFSRNPTNSTIADKAAFVLAAADAQYLAAAPFTLTAAASAGATQTFAAQSLSLSVQNRDASATQNLYVVLVAGGAVTPAVGDLFFSISGVQD